MAKNYYEILGLKSDATLPEIKKAFKKLSKKFHPDKNRDDDGYFESMFKSINEAYQVLIDEDKRATFDSHHSFSDEEIVGSNFNLDGLSLGARVAINCLSKDSDKVTLYNFVSTVEKINWETIYTNSIFDLKNENYAGKPVAFVGTVSSISQPFPIAIDNDKMTAYSMNLQDHKKDELTCFTIPYEEFKNDISDLFSNHRFVVFRGTIFSYGLPFNEYWFYLHEIAPRVTPEDLIKLRPDLKGRVAKLFLKVSKGGNLLYWIKDTIVKKMGIMGLDVAKELDTCLDFMILQSFSHGKSNKASMKLHSLVIGPPGVGKKLLTITAKILNPISEEITSTDGKITIAGLVGSSSKAKGGGFKSIPGYLPRASSGVLCIQDFHEVKKNRKAIFSLLSKMMEDGEVIDSTSAGWIHEAITSIHLDTNKYSQVGLTDGNNSIKDIDIPTNILSRFDFIIDIPRDIERQFEIAEKINKGEKSLKSYGEEESKANWRRDLQRIVAYVRTNFNDVTIPQKVSEYISEKIAFARIEYENKFNDLGLMADIVTRLIISIQKYVKAITSANLRTIAQKKDVDYAFKFILFKLDYLSSLDGNNVSMKFNDKKIFSPDDRIKLIQEKLEGKIVDGKMVLEIYKEYPNFIYDLSTKTIVRDLDKAGEKVKRGKWKIPFN